MEQTEKQRLSYELVELYKSYKRKTEVAQSWLAETCKLEEISLPNPVNAAQSVTKRGIKVPTELYFVFKDVMDQRISVGQQYKQQLATSGTAEALSKANKQHDYFIFQLKLIFQTLFPKPPTEALTSRLAFTSITNADENAPPTGKNRFKPLAIDDPDSTLDSHSILPVPISPTKGKTIGKGLAPSNDVEAQLLDSSSDDFLIGDPLEGTMTFLTFANETDALISDVKKVWEKAGNKQCTVMYAALYTKLSIDVAEHSMRRVVERLELEDFQWLVNYSIGISMNFICSPPRTAPPEAGFPPIKHPQYSREGAFTTAVMKPLDTFLTQQTSAKTQVGKTIKPKDLTPWQTTFLDHTPMPEALRLQRNPEMLVQYIQNQWAAADQLSEVRSSAILTMLQDMNGYRLAALKAAKKQHTKSMYFFEAGAIDFQMKPLFAGIEDFLAFGGKDVTAKRNIWLTLLYESYNSFL